MPKPTMKADPREAEVKEATGRPTAPKLWKLADQSGQVWTHHDPAWLRQWVTTRNQALVAARTSAYRPSLFFPSFSACPGGVCPPNR